MLDTKKVMRVGSMLAVLLAGGVLLSGTISWAAGPQAGKAAPSMEQTPFAEKELIKLIKHNKKHLDALMPMIESRGLGFELTPDIEKRLLKAGATDAFIATVKKYTPSARAAAQAQGGHPGVTEAESELYSKIKGEKDPDQIIQGAEDYAQKYPKSPLLTYILGMEAAAYQQKNDAGNCVKYAEKSLMLDSNNLMSLLLASSILPQPQMMNVPDAMKENRLKLAEAYATKALQQIDKLPKLPNETDDAYKQRLAQIESGAYASLGMVHLERAGMSLTPPDMDELGKAEQNYKQAVENTKSPSPAVFYRLGETYSQEGKVDDAISAFTNAGKLAPGTIFEQLADKEIKQLKAKKAQGSAPAKN